MFEYLKGVMLYPEAYSVQELGEKRWREWWLTFSHSTCTIERYLDEWSDFSLRTKSSDFFGTIYFPYIKKYKTFNLFVSEFLW